MSATIFRNAALQEIGDAVKRFRLDLSNHRPAPFTRG